MCFKFMAISFFGRLLEDLIDNLLHGLFEDYLRNTQKQLEDGKIIPVIDLHTSELS